MQLEMPQQNSVERLREIKNEVLSGLTVSFAMVPEVVAFAFVAGVNPLVGLYAAFTIGLVTSLFGGRPGMISGAAGSLAVVCAALVARHGVEYLFATVFLMGCLQAFIGICKWGKFIQLVPHPVVLGFVNGLAIVIFAAQLRHFKTEGPDGLMHWTFGPAFWIMAGLVALTMGITYLLPKITRVIPSALAAIFTVAVLVTSLRIPTKLVGDLARIHGGLPHFHIPAVPMTWDSLGIVLPYAFILAAVGLTESLLTLVLIDQITETTGDSSQECIGQGLANIVTGVFGGMGGCAMIAQSMMNITSGGRKRLSGIAESLFILSFIVLTSGLIAKIPMAALVGVMFVVVIKTFAWSSLRILHKIPRADAFVLVLVSVVTVFTNLATAVIVGVLVSALKFAWANATAMTARRYEDAPGKLVYEVHGPLFFGSTQAFAKLFNPKTDPDHTVADFRYTRLHDHSALEAITSLADAYAKRGKTLHLSHLSPECQDLLTKAGDMVIDVTVSDGPHLHVATERLALGAAD